MPSTLTTQLKQAIHHLDPYAGFDETPYPEDLTGGDIFPIWQQVVDAIHPKLCIEVGSWRGKSAIHLADLLQEQGDDFTIVCVDTWLGSDPVHQWSCRDHPVWGMKDNYLHGYPLMYFQFLANVLHHGYQDNIVPLPNTSNVAAKFFLGVQLDGAPFEADLIYIDACHDEDEVYLDLAHYWPLLRPGGVMIGDDFDAGWYGVICAVNRFARERDLKVMLAEGNKWLLQKPPDPNKTEHLSND